MFEPEVFWKQMYSIEGSAYDIDVTFWTPQWFGIQGIVPLAPLVSPLVMCNKNKKILRK